MPRRGKKQWPVLYFAEEWGLESADKRRLHARRLVTVDVMVREPPQRSVFALPLSERMPALKRARIRRTRALAVALRKLRSVEVTSTSHGLRCTLRVMDLDRIRRLSGAGYIWVRRVKGLRRSSSKHHEEWFAVRGRVAIQTEGQTRGLQQYEDRILLVRGRTSREAERRALREFVNYAKLVYLTVSGRRVRWKLEKVIDIYETDVPELDPKGTEVWSSLHARRMRKEYEWHPPKHQRLFSLSGTTEP
jgi:hypothetical protein